MMVRALAVAAMMACSLARGQVMADRVPNDALLYAGWAGTAALGPAYDGSHLKALLEALKLPEFLDARIQEAMDKQAAAGKGDEAKLVKDLLTLVARSPGGVYVGPFETAPEHAQPYPRIAVFSKVGKETAAAAAAKLDESVKKSHKASDPPVSASAVGDYLLVFVGNQESEKNFEHGLTAEGNGESLAATDGFKKTMTQLGPGAAQPAVMIYVNAEQSVTAVQEVMQNAPEAGAMRKAIIPAIVDGAGLSGLRQIGWAGSFDGADWSSATFIGMRERRNGLLAFFDNPPLTEESLKLIPSSATMAGAVRFDGERLLKDVSDAAATVDPRMPQQIETVLTQAWAWTGIDLKHELLPSLGDEFIYYSTPEAAGSSMRGLTLVNRLRDSQKAESALSAAENFANLLILQRNPNSKAQFQVQPLPAPLENVKAHVLTVGNLTPAWAIQNGVLFVSMSVPGLEHAIETAESGKESILQNPQFVAMEKKLGRDKFSSFSYADLSASAPEIYDLVSSGLSMAAARSGDPTKAYTLPPLSRLMPEMGLQMRVGWTDADGYHRRERAPFPGARVIGPMQVFFLRLGVQTEQRRPAAPATGLP